MGKPSVDSLLEDAYLVLEYAVRAGRLPDDSLPNAIKDVEAGSKDGFLPSMVTLSRAMNSAVSAIAPVTLIDLRAGRSPFDTHRLAATRHVQYVLCGITVLLGCLIAYFSLALQSEQNALREYQELQSAQIAAKTSALRRMVEQDKVLQTKDSRYEAYLRAVRELKELDSRRQTNLGSLTVLANERWLPFEDELAAAAATVAAWLQPPRIADADPKQAATDLDKLKASPAEEACSKRVQAKPPALRNAATTMDDVRADTLDEFCFFEAVGVSLGMVSGYYPISEVNLVRDKVVLQSGWILPFLTALLGAAVFLLRDSLNPLTANFGAPRAFVRLSIGGVAGIIIGWFWTPTGTLGAELASVSSVPLALAFVTGFSIDILFSVLDRVRRAVSTGDAADKSAASAA